MFAHDKCVLCANKIEKVQSKTRKIDKEFLQKLKKLLSTCCKMEQKLLDQKVLYKSLKFFITGHIQY